MATTTRRGWPHASVPTRHASPPMLLLTLRGTPTLYYGDELGMTNGSIPREMIHDPAELKQPGIGMGRDPERTPMLWDASPHAGFTMASRGCLST